MEVPAGVSGMAGLNTSTLVPPLTRIDDSPASLLRAASRIVSDCFQREKLLEERRTEPRRVLHQMVSVVPLANDPNSFEPIDQPITAFVRDISARGVGLLHANPFPSRRLLVTFPMIDGEAISLLVQVKWCCSMGDFGYASGGYAAGVLKSG